MAARSLRFLPKEDRALGCNHLKVTVKHWLPEIFHHGAKTIFSYVCDLLANDFIAEDLSVDDGKQNAMKIQMALSELTHSANEQRVMMVIVGEMMVELEDQLVEQIGWTGASMHP